MTTIAMPICAGCKDYNRDGGWGFRCAAFPDGIPEAITFSEVDHRDPFDGDRGIRFEPIDDEVVAYAELLFSPMPECQEDLAEETDDPARAEVA